MIKKKSVPYLEKKKEKIFSIYILCAHGIGLNFLLKTSFTSCIIEATIFWGI